MKKNAKILLVEDDANIASGLQKVMRAEGYEIVALDRGDEGLKRALQDDFDVVITDLKLPGLDGLELVKQLRQAKPKLPILLITAHGSTETAIEATKWGAFDYLPKPFPQSQLLAMLNKCVSAKLAAAASEGPQPGGAAPAGADTSWASPEGSESVLDAEALERLREVDPRGENQLLGRVLKAFEASAARLVPQVQHAMRAADHAGVRHVAHTLKSSSASIGAMKLSHLCADIEARIRTERLDQLESRVEAMCAEVQVVLQALKRLLDATL